MRPTLPLQPNGAGFQISPRIDSLKRHFESVRRRSTRAVPRGSLHEGALHGGALHGGVADLFYIDVRSIIDGFMAGFKGAFQRLFRGPHLTLDLGIHGNLPRELAVRRRSTRAAPLEALHAGRSTGGRGSSLR